MTYKACDPERPTLGDSTPVMIKTCAHAYPERCTKLSVVSDGKNRLCAVHYDLACAKRGFYGQYSESS